MIRSIKAFVLPVLTGFAILTVVGLAGSGLFLYREATAVHPVLGWLVAAALLAALALLVVFPVVRLLGLPRTLVPPRETSGPRWNRFVRRYAARLVQNRNLQDDYPALDELTAALEDSDAVASGRLEEEVDRALRHLDRKAERIVKRHAALVFTTTAISQSGRLDAALVLSAQLRMVREVAHVYYQRPRLRELWRLYANVGTAGFLAGEIQDSELLAVLGAPVTAGITSFIPVAGASPLVSLLVNSLLDGSANAFLTLRIGVLARRYAGLKIEPDRGLVARSASLESAALLGEVVSRGAGRVALLTRRLILQSAAQGTSRAAKGVVGLGSSLFDKVLSLAGRAGAKAAESTSEGLRFLQESLSFWETVAADGKEEQSLAPPHPERG
jgi:hypothetical protein